LQNCQREVREAESMFRQHGIPFISTTHRSIEEIASTVLQKSKLSKKF
jgi:regulator of PEP synthase PpsR (kinase-PPPase family)